jgi:hypothetical protein
LVTFTCLSEGHAVATPHGCTALILFMPALYCQVAIACAAAAVTHVAAAAATKACSLPLHCRLHAWLHLQVLLACLLACLLAAAWQLLAVPQGPGTLGYWH